MISFDCEFFGEFSPQSRDIVVSSVNPIISPQRSRPGPQPAFRSDPLKSFPSFSGPSFDTFLLEEARDGPGGEFSQPTFSSFSSPPSSVGQQRGREGSARWESFSTVYFFSSTNCDLWDPAIKIHSADISLFVRIQGSIWQSVQNALMHCWHCGESQDKLLSMTLECTVHLLNVGLVASCGWDSSVIRDNLWQTKSATRSESQGWSKLVGRARHDVSSVRGCNKRGTTGSCDANDTALRS